LGASLPSCETSQEQRKNPMTSFKSTIASIVVAGAFSALAILPGHTGENLDAIKAAGVIKIGTEGTYAPFTYHDASNKLVGFDVEIGEAIAEKLGVKPEFVEGKWDGLIAGLDVKRYDTVINQVGITEERKAKFDFSDPYIASKAALIVREDNADIKGFADLGGKKAAQSLTSNYGKMAEQAGAQLVGTDGFDQSIALVVQGRADATINDSLSFLDFKKKQPNAPVKIAATENEAAYSGVIVRKGDPELVAAINQALKDIKADGTYQKIAEKYFGQDVSQ
jgi:cystine transport system substrate-binding protein